MELELKLETIRQIEAKYSASNWILRKVWLDEKTNAIRVRFKHETIGMISGIVKPNFIVKEIMTLEEIEENVTIDLVKVSELIARYIELENSK